MKKLLIALLFVSTLSYAHGHRPVPDPVGPQGPAGPAGQNGINGVNGLNGNDGAAGKDGVAGAQGSQGQAGSDATVNNTLTANVGVAVQWHEWDSRVSLNSGYRYDIHHGGHTIDALIVGYRFGKSATDRQIDELKKQIEALRELQKVINPPSEIYYVPTQKTTIKGGGK